MGQENGHDARPFWRTRLHKVKMWHMRQCLKCVQSIMKAIRGMLVKTYFHVHSLRSTHPASSRHLTVWREKSRGRKKIQRRRKKEESVKSHNISRAPDSQRHSAARNTVGRVKTWQHSREWRWSMWAKTRGEIFREKKWRHDPTAACCLSFR